MKLVVQRVQKAQVTVNDNLVGKIAQGLFILVGIGKQDGEDEAEKLAKKILNLRIMADSEDKMNLSIKEVSGELLVVSQFTLYADTRKGNRPSFLESADPKKAEKIYNHFVKALQKGEVHVETGEFGAFMNIDADLDGPVTIVFDTDL